MTIIALLSIALMASAYGGELSFECKKLISGNANGQAYTVAKSLDFHLIIDQTREDAEIRGALVTKDGAYNRDGDVQDLYAFFTDGRKFKRQGDVITVTSFERNLWLCGIAMGSPCRQWETLVYNVKTNEGKLEKSHSKNAVMGKIDYSLSVTFSCSKI